MISNFILKEQSSLRINYNNYIIYFDPYLINNEYNYDADYIFITHSHYDHFSKEDILSIKNSKTKIIIPFELENEISNLGFIKDNILLVRPNENYKVDNINFSTVPAYNINKNFHKKEYNWVGYVINYNNESYYIMGDTDATEESKSVVCDKLFIPIGGTYTMNYIEASELTNIIKPKEVYPIHYGSIVGDISLGEQFSKLIDNNIKVNTLIK